MRNSTLRGGFTEAEGFQNPSNGARSPEQTTHGPPDRTPVYQFSSSPNFPSSNQWLQQFQMCNFYFTDILLSLPVYNISLLPPPYLLPLHGPAGAPPRSATNSTLVQLGAFFLGSVAPVFPFTALLATSHCNSKKAPDFLVPQ